MVLPKELIFVTLFLLTFIFSETHAARKRVKVIHELPSYFPVCYRNDPELNKCLLAATNQVRPYLVKGVPELRIPPFEPFFLPEINLQLGTTSLNYSSVLKNILIHGLSKYEFTRFDFDVPNLQFFCEFNSPSLRAEGDYSVAGQILRTPIRGDGRFTASFDSSKGTLYSKYKEATLEDGKVHIVPIFTNSTMDIVGPKGHLEGLFNGNDELNKIVNKVINDNIDELFLEFKPALEETVIKVADELLFKSLTGNIPYDDLYKIKK